MAHGKTRRRMLSATAAALAFAAPVPAIAQAQTFRFNIPAQPLDNALRAFARTSRQQILFDRAQVRGRRNAALIGSFTAEQGLARLLQGSGLSARRGSRGAFIVSRRETAAEANPGEAEPAAGAPDDATRLAEASQPDGEDQSIVITGSRIPNVSPTSPVVQVRREDLDRGGYTNVTEALANTPQNFGGTTSATTRLTGGNAGLTNQVDIRGLGSEATLVLVNGRRISPGAGDQGRAVDVSSIPISAIQRIDILTDGASALYGSDAIGGVVNIVLRSDFNGAETTLHYGFNRTGADNFLASQTLGTHWATGRILATVQYDYHQALETRELGITSVDFRPRGGGDFRDAGFGSPGTVLPGAFFAGLPFTNLTGPGGTPVFSASLPPGNGRNLQLSQLGLNQVNSSDLVSRDLTPRDRNISVYATAEQEIGPVTLFADGGYSLRKSRLRTLNSIAQIFVPETNAFSPFGEPVFVGYEFAELGPVIFDVENENWFVNGGARGGLGWRDWRWEIVGTYSQNHSQRQFDAPDFAELGTRLASSDPAFAFNPFGDGTGQSPGVVDAISSRQGFLADTSLWSVEAQANGELATLPAGPVRLALGADYRAEDLSVSDATDPSGANLFAGADRDIVALFGEAYVPVLGHSPIGDVDLSLAGRFEHYSDFGDTFNPKVGALWRPFSGLLLRANWGRSFRAPSLRELFLFQQTIPSLTLFDPNAPGGPAIAFADLTVGGNPDLQEERATTYTLSGEYRPRWWDGAHLSLTYFHTSYRDRIRGILDGLSIGTLFQFESALPPGVIVRDAAGNLQAINLVNINSARTIISGFDVTAGYEHDTSIGRLGFNATATILDRYTDQIVAGAPVLDLKGTTGNPPDWRARAELTWSRGPWSAFAAVNHVDGLAIIDPDPRIVRRSVDSQTTVDVQLAWTAGVTAGWLRGLSLRLGATNLFDSRPPFFDSPANFGVDSQNYVISGRTIYVRLTKLFDFR